MTVRQARMIGVVGTTRVPAFDGTRLQKARERLGWSRGRLAAEVDKAVASISGWERNLRTPEAATLVALAKAVGLEPADLLDTPKEQWGVAEFRVTTGQQQQEAARAIGVHPVRLSHIEAGYEQPSAEVYAALAEEYGATEQEIRDAWTRTRLRLRAP